VEYLLRRNDEFISIDGRKETNLERAKVKDEEIKAVLEGLGLAIRSYLLERQTRYCWT
jgi:hypothetical protein